MPYIFVAVYDFKLKLEIFGFPTGFDTYRHGDEAGRFLGVQRLRQVLEGGFRWKRKGDASGVISGKIEGKQRRESQKIGRFCISENSAHIVHLLALDRDRRAGDRKRHGGSIDEGKLDQAAGLFRRRGDDDWVKSAQMEKKFPDLDCPKRKRDAKADGADDKRKGIHYGKPPGR